jgi:AcrR family transcriptional regulator
MGETGSRRDQEKETREKSIIDTAETLFLEEGFDAASMDEIASRAGFTKRTVYQYFAGKEELLFAVAVRQLALTDFTPFAARHERTETAFAWLSRSCADFFRTCRANPERTAFVNRAFALQIDSAEGKWRMEFGKRTKSYYSLIVAALGDGIAEGSIRQDVAPEKAAFTFMFFLTNFIRYITPAVATATARLDGKGDPYQPLPVDELFAYSLGQLLDSVAP